MPHLVIQSTPQLDRETDMGALCRTLADTMIGLHDGAFAYFNLRITRGRSAAVKQAAGAALVAAAREFLAPVLARRPVGLTFQIDEGDAAFDARFGNLHALYARP